MFNFLGDCDSVLVNEDIPTPVRYYDGHSNYYICKKGFTKQTARVICREGGYGDVEAIGQAERNSTGVNYAISNRLFQCNGNERSLCACSYSTQICENEDIALVQCKPTGKFTHLSLRNNMRHGRVHRRLNNI